MPKATHKNVKFTAAEMAKDAPTETDFSKMRKMGRGKKGQETAAKLACERRLARKQLSKTNGLREYTVVISQAEDGWMFATVAELAGCQTQAKTMDSLMKRVKEAIAVCIDDEGPTGVPARFVGVQRIAVNK